MYPKMPSTRTHDPEEPSISPDQGKKLLEAMKSQGEKILVNRPATEATYRTWEISTVECITGIFGSSSGHINTFHGPIEIGGAYELSPREEENHRADILKMRLGVLEQLIGALDLQIAVSGHAVGSQGQEKGFDFWSLMHPAVVQVAKSRFETKHYADAVEAALKELNARVKELVKERAGKELDGASLMHTAFSLNSPIIVLEDLSTDSGEDIQRGYMELYAGAMSGIRNPQAHGNAMIDDKRAIHFLFLASLLFYKLDERR